MDKYLSDKLKIISFLLIIVVLYIHSIFNSHYGYQSMQYLQFVQFFFGTVLGNLAVPFFLIISGYLFFYDSNTNSFDMKRKLKSRFKTLFIPYICGCILITSFYFFISVAPFLENKITGYDNMFKKSIFVLIKEVFLITDNMMPIAYHLWFLRDLILIVLFTPLLFYFFKYLKWYGVFILFCLSLFNLSFPFPIQSMFWFSIGAVLNFKPVKWKINKIGLTLLVLYLFVSFYKPLLSLISSNNLNSLYLLTGISGIWFSYDQVISEKFNLEKFRWLNIACGFTFFIYIYHSPAINIWRKSIVLLCGKSEISYIIAYVLSPIIMTITLVSLGIFFKKHTTKLYSILSGGR